MSSIEGLKNFNTSHVSIKPYPLRPEKDISYFNTSHVSIKPLPD